MLQVLHRLVNKPLVIVEEQSGRSRYRLLEPVRQYAHEQLGAEGALAEVRRRHALFFLAFAEKLEQATNIGGNPNDRRRRPRWCRSALGGLPIEPHRPSRV